MKQKMYVLETLMSEENEVIILRDTNGNLLFSEVNNSEKLIDFLRNPNPTKFDVANEEK